MPVEIKELIIKATVSQQEPPSSGSSISQDDMSKLKKEISQEVLDKILRILQQKNER